MTKPLSSPRSRPATTAGVGVLGLAVYGIGLNIGSATFSLKNVAAGLAGNTVVVATMVVGLSVFLALPAYTVLVRARPTNAATYRYASLVHRDVGTTVAVCLAVAATAGGLPLSAVVAGRFVNAVTGFSPTVVAVASIVVFFVVNLFSLRSSTVVQGVSVALIVAAILLFATRLSTSADSFGLGGAELGGIIPAVGITYTMMAGALVIVDFGDEVRQPERVLPRALWSSMAIVFVMYLLVDLGVIASGMSPDKLREGLLFDVAAPVLSRGELGFFVLAGGVLATVSTMNGIFGFVSRLIARVANEGALPQVLGRTNSRGAPTYALALMLVVSLVVLALGLPLTMLGSAVNIGLLVAVGSVVLSGVLLPRLHPQLWAAGRGRMSPWLIRVTSGLALLVNLVVLVVLLQRAWVVGLVMLVLVMAAIGARRLTAAAGKGRQ